MIDLTDLRRVQLRGSSLVHAIAASAKRITACGMNIHLYGPNGRAYDQPHEPTAAVTCRACQRAEKKP